MRRRGAQSGFTITELLVAMAIIAVLGALTVVAVRGVSRDARMASGVNAVTAALNDARAYAMRNNTMVVCVFRPRLLSPTTQAVEIVLAEWTGQSYANPSLVDGGVIDRFVPIQGVEPRRLPRGVKIAAPLYRQTGTFVDVMQDDTWVTQAHLPGINQSNAVSGSNEPPGSIVGVMYAPDGTLRTVNARSNSVRIWVDVVTPVGVDGADRMLRWQGQDRDVTTYNAVADFWEQWFFDDEPFVELVPFLAVYDDALAREELDPSAWRAQNPSAYQDQLIGPEGFIATNGKRIHFNTYTGVVMTTEDR